MLWIVRRTIPTYHIFFVGRAPLSTPRFFMLWIVRSDRLSCNLPSDTLEEFGLIDYPVICHQTLLRSSENNPYLRLTSSLKYTAFYCFRASSLPL